jgi:hypothetical protein
MFLLLILEFLWCIQKEFASVADMAVKFYCEKVPHERRKSLAKLHELMEKAME